MTVEMYPNCLVQELQKSSLSIFLHGISTNITLAFSLKESCQPRAFHLATDLPKAVAAFL